MNRKNNKKTLWICIAIVILLLSIVWYQKSQSNTSGMKSVRNNEVGQTTNNYQVSGDNITTQPTEDIPVVDATLSGATQTGDTATGTIAIGDTQCVTNYQTLLDRSALLTTLSSNDAQVGLLTAQTMTFCNGSTPQAQEFLSVKANGQTISYDNSTNSGGMLTVDNKEIIPDFVKNCTGETTCPTVQAIRATNNTNQYVVLETTQPRSFQSSFRLISTNNGVSMLFWSALNYVDPIHSYSWGPEGHFAFIASSAHNTYTYIVQPKGFPTTARLINETDTPLSLTFTKDNTIVILYDRNPSNTDTSDRYTKVITLDEFQTPTDQGTGTSL